MEYPDSPRQNQANPGRERGKERVYTSQGCVDGHAIFPLCSFEIIVYACVCRNLPCLQTLSEIKESSFSRFVSAVAQLASEPPFSLNLTPDSFTGERVKVFGSTHVLTRCACFEAFLDEETASTAMRVDKSCFPNSIYQ